MNWKLAAERGIPFGRVARRVQEAGQPNLRPLSVYLGLGVVPRDERHDNFNRLGEDLSKYLVVRPGDVVFNKLRTWQGGLGVSGHHGLVSPAYFVCRPVDGVHPPYLGYVLTSAPYLAELTRISKWMPPSQFDISWEDLKRLPLDLPPYAQQVTIADFLNAEAARIDDLLRLRRDHIVLLGERHRSEISALVSEGEEVPLRRVIALRTSGPRGWAELVGETGAPFVRSANLRRDTIELALEEVVRIQAPAAPEANRSRIARGDVLVGITGANTGWVGLVGEDVEGGYISQHVALLRPLGVDPSWLAYSMFSTQGQQQLLAGQYGGTKQQLGLDDLAKLRIRLPRRELQSELVRQLNRSRAHTQRAERLLARQIELLRERKMALITAAVTGQLALAREIAAEES